MSDSEVSARSDLPTFLQALSANRTITSKGLGIY